MFAITYQSLVGWALTLQREASQNDAEYIANASGIAPGRYRKIEQGKSVPTVAELHAACRAIKGTLPTAGKLLCFIDDITQTLVEAGVTVSAADADKLEAVKITAHAQITKAVRVAEDRVRARREEQERQNMLNTPLEVAALDASCDEGGFDEEHALPTEAGTPQDT